MKTLALTVLLALSGIFNLPAQTTNDYATARADAEKLFSEGSYARAHDAYQKAKGMDLSTAEHRWVDFRLADTLWRSQAATQTADTTQLDNGRKQLELLIRDITRVEDHDRVWAEVKESLGDYYWIRRNQQNWGAAWGQYQEALDWWAGMADIELARERYLKIIKTCAKPTGIVVRDYSYGYWGNILPMDVLENALKISRSENDKAYMHYLIAMTMRNSGGDWDRRHRVPEDFEAALKPGKETDWYDDALYNYAEWMMNTGRVFPLTEGGWRQEPDFVKALELFRRLVREFQKGETRYFDQATQQIKSITDPVADVSVGHVFLPDSEIQYSVHWRNVKRVEFTLYEVDLTRDVKLSGNEERRNDWLQSIDLAGKERVKTWSRETKDMGDHKPGHETLRYDGKLAPGAYVLEARGEGKASRDLVLVTDASIVLKTSGKQALVYMCNALDGSPIADATLHLWEGYRDDNRWQWRDATKKSGTNGIAVFDLMRMSSGEQIFVGGVLSNRQAFSVGNSYYSGRNNEDTWKIYATTDRPAYRPKETAQWKFTARRYNGSVYSTPSDQVLEFEINDPRGTKVKEGKATLNTFGSAWGELELTEAMPLGEYRVRFWSQSPRRSIGTAVLFRLEEYKLPEFKVTVQMPEENGKKKAFRIGETVEVNIQADYYFGGAVANANVEVVVYQNPFYKIWRQPREFPWYYEDLSSEMQYRRYYRGGQGQLLKRETLKTDASGKAKLTFETPRNSGQDFEYRIEARVTDASRREIVGNGTARVTRQRYYVNPVTQRNIYRPQDRVTVEFKAQDANEQPVQTEGIVKVTRDFWFEIWLDPNGREIKGDELKQVRDRTTIFPPPPSRPDERPWRLKFRGYEHDQILTRTLKTDTNGAAELTFTPERDGYYRIAWSSEDTGGSNAPPAPPITAQATVWVATTATTELGYRQGGLEIIVDKDTFRAGQTAPIMLVAPANDRYVLFSVEGQDLHSYQLVHLTGTVKLIELPIEEAHVPNIFLSATMVADRQVFIDTKQIVVPPTKNFITVDVKSDREQYQPREEGTFTITTLDDRREPVAAEISFGLVDESVYYIQSDYAGDPRKFYFGQKRPHQIQNQSTFNQKSYAKLVPWENDQLIDERDRDARQKQAMNIRDEDFDVGAGEKRAELEAGAPVRPQSAVGMRGGGGGGRGGAMFAEDGRASDSVMSLATRLPEAQAAKSMATSGAIGRPDMPAEGEEPAVQVRSDFRSTIVWKPDVVTGRDGKATVKVKYPDSLTAWKATARAVTALNQFGITDTNTRTKQPLIVRLQAPRFFLVGDFAVVSAVINNNTDQPMSLLPKLEAAGVDVTGLYINGEPIKANPGPINVPANGEARRDWYVHVSQAKGEAKLKVSAQSGRHADAMEKSFPVYEHGIEKFVSKSGKVRGDDITLKLNLPKERKAGTTSLMVQVTPSMAVTMLDALPYLVDYPYGCTEQTMSRFLPVTITAKTLKDLGLSPEDAMYRAFGGIEQTNAAATHPGGKKDLDKLADMQKQGLERLYDFQHADGGWGWWKEGESDHWMTAYVVWGLSLAKQADVTLKANVLERAVAFLDKEIVEEETNPDMQAWVLHALAVYHTLPSRADKMTGGSDFQKKAFDNLWTNRDKLNAYTRALLALSAHSYGYADKAKTLIANLENGVKLDNAPDTSVVMQGAQQTGAGVIGTAHWGEDGVFWRWSEGGVEATAFALRALMAIDPTNKLVEPVCNWLIKNRRGAQWNNTRDTAITVLAMNDYLKASSELSPDLEYELTVNGQSIARKKVSAAEVLNAPSQFVIDPRHIRDGENNVRIVRRSGKGPIYLAANAKYFSLEEPIPPAGSEIFVRRQYYKLVGRPTLLKGYVYEREALNDGESVRSGERIEALITIEAKNNYEYLIFEDLKPAGFEAVQIRSGESLHARELKSGAVDRKLSGPVGAPAREVAYAVKPGDTLSGIARANGTTTAVITSMNKLTTTVIRPGQQLKLPPRPGPKVDSDYTGRTRWVYQELRDRKVALFLDKLPQGVWEIKYDFRAEVPGQFHALPVLGQAMYVPEIRCNGQETSVKVEERRDED